MLNFLFRLGAAWGKLQHELLVHGAKPKTYNSGYSLVITYLTANPLVSCLSTAERTGRALVCKLHPVGKWSLRPGLAANASPLPTRVLAAL